MFARKNQTDRLAISSIYEVSKRAIHAAHTVHILDLKKQLPFNLASSIFSASTPAREGMRNSKKVQNTKTWLLPEYFLHIFFTKTSNTHFHSHPPKFAIERRDPLKFPQFLKPVPTAKPKSLCVGHWKCEHFKRPPLRCKFRLR